MPSQLLNLKQKPSHFVFEAIGTHWDIESTVTLGESLRNKILKRISAFDQAYSRFRNDSLVAAMAEKAGTYTFPADSAPLVRFYHELYDKTDGKVTPLIGRALEQSGYDKNYSFRVQTSEPVPGWDTAMKWKENIVTTERPLVLDIGAAGKGYLVDILGEILEEEGVAEYVIDASGDVRHRGAERQVIGLENPYDSSRVIGVMHIENASLCASASNRRQWGNGQHHIIDPTALSPVRGVVATWVVAETTLLADGLATALFFVEGEVLQQTWDFQFVRLMSDGKLSHSHEFMGELFI